MSITLRLEDKAMESKIEGMGRRIRNWRKDQGIKGYELARRLNISSGSLSEIERGKNLPSASTLASIHLTRILHEKEVANPFQAYKIRLNVNSKKGTRRDRLYTHPTRFPRFQTS